MKRTGKLIRVPDQEATRSDYTQGLQAMWEDRWVLLGDAGRAAWFQRHGQPPPERNPMLDPVLILRGVRGLTPGIVKGRVHRTW